MDIVIITEQVIRWGVPPAMFLLFAFAFSPGRLSLNISSSRMLTFEHEAWRMIFFLLFAGMYYGYFAIILRDRSALPLLAAAACLLGWIVNDLRYRNRRRKTRSLMTVDLPGFWEGDPASRRFEAEPSYDLDYGEDAPLPRVRRQ